MSRPVILTTRRDRRESTATLSVALAQKSDFGMPGPTRPTPSRAFRGIDDSPNLSLSHRLTHGHSRQRSVEQSGGSPVHTSMRARTPAKASLMGVPS